MGRKKGYITIFKFINRLLIWIIIILTVILVIVDTILLIPAVQNKVAGIVINQIDKKVENKVDLEKIRVTLPNIVVIKGLFIEDKVPGDTLLNLQRAKVNIDMLKLLQNEVSLNAVKLTGIRGNIWRAPNDSVLNISYFISQLSNSQKNKKVKKKNSGLQISFGTVDLQDIHFNYLDSLNQLFLRTEIGNFQTEINTLDYKNLNFDIRDLHFMDSQTQLEIISSGSVKPKKKQVQSKNITVNLEKSLRMENVAYTMKDTAKGMEMNVLAGDWELKSVTFNLDEQKVGFENIRILQSRFSNVQHASAFTDTTKTSDMEQKKNNWSVRGGSIYMDENLVKLSDYNYPEAKNKFDSKHLRIQLNQASLDDVVYSPDEIKGKIKTLSGNEGEKFFLKEVRGEFVLNENQLEASNFLVETSSSKIIPKVKATFPSKNDLFNLTDRVNLQITFDPSSVHTDDIFYFMSDEITGLQDSIPFNKFNFSADISGQLPKVDIKNLAVNTGINTSLKIHGQINGVHHLETAGIQLFIDTITTVSDDYEKFVTTSTNDRNFRLPTFIGGQGKVEGNVTSASAEIEFIADSEAVIRLNGEYNRDTVLNEQKIQGKVNIPQLNLGYFLNDTAYQYVTINGKVETVLSKDKPLQASGEIQIPDFGYRNYVYNDINLKGIYRQDRLDAALTIQDENLDFKADIAGDFSDTIPSLLAELELKKMYAHRVNLSQNNILTKGKLKFDMKGTNPDNINGNINITDVIILKNQQRFTVDTFFVKAVNSEEISSYQIFSPLLTLDYRGSMSVTRLPDVLKAHFNQYFEMPGSTLNTDFQSENHYFDLTTEIYNADIFTGVLVPGLKSFKPGRLDVHFNSAKNQLHADVNFPFILFGSMQVDSLRLSVESDADQLYYLTRLKKAGTSKFWIQGFHNHGHIADNLISNEFKMMEGDSIRYHVNSTLESTSKKLIGKLVPDSLILDYQAWKVPENNKIEFTDNGFNFSQFHIFNNGQKALVESDMENGIKKTTLSFNAFNAKTITNIITADKTLVNGLLQGGVTVWFDPGLGFTSDLKVKELAFFEEAIGDFNLMANNVVANTFNVDMSLSGRNQMAVKGSYESGANRNINLNADLTSINLETVQPFLSTYVKRLNGNLEGNMVIDGKINDPSIDGELILSDVEVIPTYLNTLVTIQNGNIVIADEEIEINDFQIRDANENTASLSGSVGFKNITNPKLDIAFTSNNFLLLNTTASSSDAPYYGKIVANLNVQAKGYATSPQLDVNVEVLDGTDLTYVVKSRSPASIERSGLVEFARKDTVSVQFNEFQSQQDTMTTNVLPGIGLQANLELNPEATIHIQLDPISEEQMTLNGKSNLSLKKNINGELSMVGRYEINQGTYELKLYEFLRREFEIKQGSYIAWSGDIANPRVDLTAIYTVETSPSELIINQTGTAKTGTSEDRMLRTKQPFSVNLSITGELLSPDLSFKLEAPPELQGTQVAAIVQNINQDESRLNQQVFSLLLLKRFMSEEMFAGGDFNQQLTSSARKGLNNLISDQLTRFAETYIQGFDINLDIDSYNNLQETDNSLLSNTQVQLNVSKTLFDERLIVKVGSNVTLEESPEQQQVPNSQRSIIGDVSVEYKLTPAGNWRLKGFNKREFEDVIDGEVTKTGVSILFSKDFYRFSDIFKNRSNRKTGEENDEK